MRSRHTLLALAVLGLGALSIPRAAWGQAATVEVENQLDREMMVWVNGEPRGVAPANGSVVFDDVPEGPVTLLASGVDRTGVEASERRVLASGETFTWTLYPIPVLGEEKGTGMLVVINELDKPVQIVVGGAMLGWVSPAGSRSFPRLVAGDVPVEALDAEQDLVEKADLTIEDGEIERWVISGAPAR